MNSQSRAWKGAIPGSETGGKDMNPRKTSPFIDQAKRRKRASTSGMRRAAERMDRCSIFIRRVERGSKEWNRHGREGDMGRMARVVRVGMEMVQSV